MGDVEIWLVGCPDSVLPPLTLARPSSVRWAKRCVRDYGCPFGHFEAVCTVSWHAALSLHHHRTPLPIDGEPRRKKIISQIKTETDDTGSCATNLPASPLFGTTNFPVTPPFCATKFPVSPPFCATNLQFLSYKGTETGVGSVYCQLLRTATSTELTAGTEIQNYAITIRQRCLCRGLENGICPGSPGESVIFYVIKIQCPGAWQKGHYKKLLRYPILTL